MKTPRRRRPAAFGFLVGFVLVALGILIMLVFLEAPLGEATVAFGTIALALATVWLGLEARSERAEVRESRFAEFLPMLRWQSPECETYSGVLISYVGAERANEPRELAIDVLCTNEGPGPARLLGVVLRCEPESAWRTDEIDIPSTMPPGNRITFKTRHGPIAPPLSGSRRLEIRVRYGDLLGEFEYETRVVIEAHFGEDSCVARFVESDERSALERRMPRRIR